MSITYIPRVTQLDAVQLDDEVIELFKGQLMDATRFLKPGILTPILPELDLALRTLLFKYSLFDKKCTFGQQMLTLKYNEKNMSHKKLYWMYGYLVGLKYLKDRLQYSFTSNRKIQSMVSAVERFQLIGDIVNFVRFLQSGRCPTLIEYILNLELTADKITRENLSDFSWTRELLWNNFIELFGTVLSLTAMFDIRKKMRIISRLNWWKKGARPVRRLKVIPQLTLSSHCAACESRPVLPHHMECEHVFCYYCLKSNKMADSDYTCPKCDYNGETIYPVRVS